jgi:hypothetical protein
MTPKEKLKKLIGYLIKNQFCQNDEHKSCNKIYKDDGTRISGADKICEKCWEER